MDSGRVSFTGIPLTALDFYEALEADNSKAFWTANKHVYDADVKAPLAALADQLEPEFGPGKMFRPYRDVRFSADKTPYKTRQGIWFDQSAVYVHVSAAGLFLAAGHWQYAAQLMDRYRAAVDDERTGATLERIVGDAAGGRLGDRRRTAGAGAVRLPEGPPAGGPAQAQDAHRAPRTRRAGLAVDARSRHRDRRALARTRAADGVAGQASQLTHHRNAVRRAVSADQPVSLAVLISGANSRAAAKTWLNSFGGFVFRVSFDVRSAKSIGRVETPTADSAPRTSAAMTP